MVILSLGTLMQPQMLLRHFTAANAQTIKWIGATLPLYLTTFYLPAALVGLGGALVMPNIAIPDRIFPEMLFAHAPAWLTGIILAGATAAAMSTLDSILHVNMSVLTRDVYQRYIRPDGEDSHYILVSRLIALALLVVGYLLSVLNPGFYRLAGGHLERRDDPTLAGPHGQPFPFSSSLQCRRNRGRDDGRTGQPLLRDLRKPPPADTARWRLVPWD